MKKMEEGKSRPTSSTSTRAPKIERKIIEKNRRNRMKILSSKLLSLLPDHGSKQAMPMPEQIDEVVAYIQKLKMKVEKMKEKKESLLPRERSDSPTTTTEIQVKPTSTPPPLVEVQDMGPNMDVISVTGLDDLSQFHSILHLLREDGTIEVAHANFSVHGYSTFQILHDKVGKSLMGFGDTTTLSRKLKGLICGSTSSEVEPHNDFSEIQSDFLGIGNQECFGAFTNLEYYQGYYGTYTQL